MADKQDKTSAKSLEEEVWTAISAFEQILEAMPNDRASLEALSHAYIQIGDHTRAKDYLIRLGNVLMDEADYEAAKHLLGKIKTYADDDSQAKELAARIEQLSEAIGVGPVAADTERKQADVISRESVRMGFSMAEELSCAWNLMEAKELSQEEYSGVVQDLTEMSSKDVTTTVSVLHVLDGRRFKNLEKVIAFVSRECGTPNIFLSGFDLRAEAVSMLPMEFMVQRGALIFELFGTDALAVVMNPYDKQLREDIQTLAGRTCHFFVTTPPEFDQALEKAQGIVAESSE